MPCGGYIKRFVSSEDTRFKFSSDKYANLSDFLKSLDIALVPIFTLVVVKTTGEVVDLGTLFMYFIFTSQKSTTGHVFKSDIPGEVEKYKTNARDILNIRTEINTIGYKGPFKILDSRGYSIDDFDNKFFAYLITILIELVPFKINFFSI